MVIISLIVKDLFQYDTNFAQTKIQFLTGKKDFKDTDIIDLSRLASLNDKNLSVFVAEKEGKQFLNCIKEDNTRTQIADAAGINNNDAQNAQQDAVSAYIPMEKSIFDYQKPQGII